MSTTKIILIIVSIFVLALIISNPSEESHRYTLKKKVMAASEKAIEETLTGGNSYEKIAQNIGLVFGGAMIDKLIDASVSRDNYVLFSYTTFNWAGNKNIIGVGILGNVFISEEVSKKIIENTKNQ